MYIYSVTYLPTKEYYISISLDNKTEFSEFRTPDPANIFPKDGDNGTKLNMNNFAKRILFSSDVKSELIEQSAIIVKEHSNEPKFKGLIDSTGIIGNKKASPPKINTPPPVKTKPSTVDDLNL